MLMPLMKVTECSSNPRVRHADSSAVQNPVMVETEHGWELHVTVKGSRYRFTSPGGLFAHFEFDSLSRFAACIHGGPVPVQSRAVVPQQPMLPGRIATLAPMGTRERAGPIAH